MAKDDKVCIGHDVTVKGKTGNWNVTGINEDEVNVNNGKGKKDIVSLKDCTIVKPKK